jgi:protein O-mannosyl-transferase
MRDTRLLKLLFISAALATALFVYRPGLSGGFALDDYTNVVDNPALGMPDLGWQSLSHAMFSFQAGPTMRPVSMLSFALNRYAAGGNSAMTYKVTNLAIHLVNGALVFVLLLRLLSIYRRRFAPQLPKERLDWLALVCGGLWLLHPLNVMPVLYVVQRETALSATFILLGLNVYVWARQRHIDGRHGIWLLWTGVPLLTVMAVLSKESGALLPVYALAIECFLFEFRRQDGGISRAILAFFGLFLILPGCAGFAWMLTAHHGGFLDYSGRDYDLRERLLSETRVLWLYIRWTIWPDPRDLGLYHDDIAISHGLLYPATTLVSLLGLASLVAACVGLRRRMPLVALGLAWFLGGQLMESTIFPLELVFEHRCYLPDLGLILAMLSLLMPLSGDAKWRMVRYVTIGIALGLCATVTWMRAYDWRDNLEFAAAEARHHPESPYATYMLGQTYANLALLDDPEQYGNAVATLRTASAVPNSTVIADVSLVLVQAQLKDAIDPDVLPRIAAKVSNRKLAASDIQGLSALGDCVDRRNCKVKAADMQAIFHAALANPYLVQLKDTQANILVIYGNYESIMDQDYEKARKLMADAAALVPTEPQYRENLVTMDIALRDAARAQEDMDALKRLNYFGHLDPVIAELQKQVSALPPPR